MKKLFLTLSLFILVACTNLVGCDNSALNGISNTTSAEAMIRIYNTSTKATEEVNLEDYVAGVVAGEMYNTWEDEALKTQCVLARTYALSYIKNNPEEYKQKGISTDILDTQNYDPSTINEKIKNACNATKGEVITYQNEPIVAYFHSNSGGKTADTQIAFSADENLPYIKSVSSPETANNSKNYSWSATFSKSEVLSALSKMGISVSNLSSARLGERDASGYYKTIILGGKEISANTFRLNIGSTKMKSTKLSSILVNGNNLIVSGTGYGHGVGVSQWGAKILAGEGKTYKEIIDYYFDSVNIKKVY